MKGDLLQMAPSLTEAVYIKLRGELLACDIRPGEKLKIGELAKRYGVNLSPVREALSRLTADGLVTFESQRGFRAAPVTLEDLLDLTRTRAEIEILCLKSAMNVGGIEWEAGIVASFHRLIRTPEFDHVDDKVVVSEAWARAHADFHSALLAACESAWLLRIRAILYNQSERYRRLAMPFRTKPSGGDGRSTSDNERDHRLLMDTALSRDTERAAKAMFDHFNRTADLAKIFVNAEEKARPDAGVEKSPTTIS